MHGVDDPVNQAAVPPGPGDAPLSRKIADAPGARELTPRSATDEPKEYELSSIFQPVRVTAVPPRFARLGPRRKRNPHP